MHTESAPFLLRRSGTEPTHYCVQLRRQHWSANRDGGELRRLTSGGHEAKPALSPDGGISHLSVNTTTPAGLRHAGCPAVSLRRLTHHPADLGM